MHISPQPGVISQIPSRMIRIVIDHDIVRVPQPSIHKAVVIRRNTEEEPAEPEPRRPSTPQPPHMRRPKTSRKVPMLPRMVQMIVRIIPPRVMPDPMIAIDMRSIRMSRRIRIRVSSRRFMSRLYPMTLRRLINMRSPMIRLRTMRRSRMLSSASGRVSSATLMLRQSRQRCRQQKNGSNQQPSNTHESLHRNILQNRHAAKPSARNRFNNL